MRSYPRFTGGGPFRPPAGTATESNPSAFPLPGVYSGCSHSSPRATAAAASSSTLAPRLAARPRTALRLPQPPRFPFHPDPLESLARRQRPGAGDRAQACLGYGPTRRDPPDGARMTPADRTGAIREPAAGGGAAPRPFRDPSEASPPCGRESKFLSFRIAWPHIRLG